jgi:alkanesulfonate monooxygenase
MNAPLEISWFSALCDDDYEFLGVPEPTLRSSWEHCRDIVLTADRNGFDNILLPSGFELGIDSTAFAAGVGPQTEQIHLLLAVRIGEMWLPQLARQLATINQMVSGRLTINIISSDMPGQSLDSTPRYERTREYMHGLRSLLNGERLESHGDFTDFDVDPPRIITDNPGCPPMYFGGFSDAAKETAAEAADVFLTWPDTVASVSETISDMRARADRFDRTLRYGLRAHMIVRETEAEAREAAERLVSKLDDDTGAAIRGRSLDSGSVGVSRQADLRSGAGDDGYAEANLWTGVGRARSGAGAAIVGDPDQVVAKLRAYQDVGIEAFVLSGYTHIAECDLVARYVLPEVEHSALKPRWP